MEYLMVDDRRSLLDYSVEERIQRYVMEGWMNAIYSFDIGCGLCSYAEACLDLIDRYPFDVCATISDGASYIPELMEHAEMKRILSVYRYVSEEESVWASIDQVLKKVEDALTADIRKKCVICLGDTMYRDCLCGMDVDSYNAGGLTAKPNVLLPDSLRILSVFEKCIHQKDLWSVFEICAFLYIQNCEKSRIIVKVGPGIFAGLSAIPPLVLRRLCKSAEIYYPKAHEKAA